MLVVDDEPPIVLAISDYFESLGFVVDVTGELEEAQALIDCRAYAVVLTDLHLRKVTGLEGLELLSYARQKSPSTFIILLTAYGSPEIEERAHRLGVDAFLHKPQPLAKVADIVMKLFDGNPSP
jgi:CheY-like chemotaxis protein